MALFVNLNHTISVVGYLIFDSNYTLGDVALNFLWKFDIASIIYIGIESLHWYWLGGSIYGIYCAALSLSLWFPLRDLNDISELVGSILMVAVKRKSIDWDEGFTPKR